ncbi:MAG: EAL domain-containing protein [Lachnospiraceae bacterium]|nr:EAL domain-containing protein [Lachnospiraceae bacterium]
MGRTKEKRISRLKKKRIWPSIVGLFFVLIFFVVVILVGLGLVVVEVTNRKLTEGYERSLKAAELYKENEADLLTNPNNPFLLYLDITDEIDAISVVSENGEGQWSSNGQYPDISLASMADFYFLGNNSPIHIILEADENVVYFDSDNSLMVNETLLVSMVGNNLFHVFLDSTESVFDFSICFLMPAGSDTVCVTNHISVYGYDVQMLLFFMAIVILLVGVFTLYYIISFIGMMVNQRRTTKIIYTDLLTGGDNWMYFTKKSKKLIRKVGAKRKYAVIHLRMKKYRSFCTCFGINKGEELIERLYYTIKKQLRRKETMAHYEKADFGLLLTYTDELELATRLERMVQNLEGVFPNIKLKYRIGVCEVENSRANVEELYNNALLAREMHGDDNEQKIAFFNIEMSKQRIWERKVEDDMERALMNKEFQVYLQPKFSTGEETLGGAEALVRWIHPTEGFVPPNRFIPIFEQNGFILKLDDFMLEEVAKQQAKWISEGWKVVPISVNVSRAHFTREDLAEHICEIVDRYQVPHNVIELELTESAFFDDKEMLLSTVKKLRDAGFSVSMDDFGAGYSSLNSLKELSLDVLKIDADFFRGTDSLDRGMLIVTEVINLAKKLNMKIVAEGIESREQVDFLKEQECDLIQGYYFAKPMPLGEFEKTYKNVGQEEMDKQE